MPQKPEFDELLAHDAYVRALAQALVADAAGADDVAQATWLAAWKGPPRESTNLKHWLAVTVRSFASKWRRSAER